MHPVPLVREHVRVMINGVEQQSLVNVWHENNILLVIVYVHMQFLLVIMCPTLLNPENGLVTVNTHTVSGVANYTCNNGYNLTGAVMRMCAQNGVIGQWIPEEPTCPRKLIVFASDHNDHGTLSLSHSAVDCGPLNNPTNGQVMVPATTFNNMATYSCNSGYTLNGAQTRTCQASGVWSNAEPTCQGE